MSFDADNKPISIETLSQYDKRKTLIEIVQKYPIIYLPVPNDVNDREHKNNLKTAWNEIALKLNPDVTNCRQRWAKMYHTYAKLKMLFDEGTVSRKAIKSFGDINKYLDGSLTFLDPYLSQKVYSKIPLYIHKHINTKLGLPVNHGVTENDHSDKINIATHEQVISLLRLREDSSDSFDVDFLKPIVESAIKCKLEKLLIEKANITNNDNDETETSTQINLGLESELIIDEDVKLENQEENDTLEENLTPDTITIPEEHILPDVQIPYDSIITADKNDPIVISNNNEFIGTVSDDYIRNFCNDLGETMSVELSKSKQKLLQLRINKLLRQLQCTI